MLWTIQIVQPWLEFSLISFSFSNTVKSLGALGRSEAENRAGSRGLSPGREWVREWCGREATTACLHLFQSNKCWNSLHWPSEATARHRLRWTRTLTTVFGRRETLKKSFKHFTLLKMGWKVGKVTVAKQQPRWNAPIRAGSFVATYGEPAMQTQTQTRMCRLFPNLPRPPPTFIFPSLPLAATGASFHSDLGCGAHCWETSTSGPVSQNKARWAWDTDGWRERKGGGRGSEEAEHRGRDRAEWERRDCF